MAWMTTYAAQLLSRFQVGHDGHTPHERLRGKPFKVALPEFGETVWRHLPVKKVHRDERGKLKVRWEKATFLGLAPMTNEFYLWDGTKMVKARGVRRTTTADRWDKTAIETIARFPWSHHAHAAPPRAILEDQEPPDPANTVPQAMPQIRDLYVRKVDLLRHGFTEGCGKCDAIRAGLPSPISHTSRCRARITEALGQDNPRLQRVRERFGRHEVEAEQHPVELEPPPKELELPDEISAQEESEVEDEEMIGDDDSMEGEENDPAVVQDDEEDIKAFLRHENEELAREVKDLIIALGGNAGKHWRQVRKKLNRMVAEIHNPPAVTAIAKLLPNGVLPGLVLDLTTLDEEGKPWDFRHPVAEEKS